MPVPSRDTDNVDLEDISRRYESMRTRPETKSRLGGDLVRAWDLERGLPNSVKGKEGSVREDYVISDIEKAAVTKDSTTSLHTQNKAKLTCNLINGPLQLLIRSYHSQTQISVRNRTRTLHPQPSFNCLPLIRIPLCIFDRIFHYPFRQGAKEFFGQGVTI